MSQNNHNNKPTPAKKQKIIEELWLHYYNSALLASGSITEEEYRKMKLRIINRSAAAK